MSASPRGIGSSFLVAAATAVGLSFVVLASATAPADAHEAAGVFPPWWAESEALAAASRAGAVQGVGALPFIVSIRDPGGRAARRLRTAGALFTIDPQGLLACSGKEVPSVPVHR